MKLTGSVIAYSLLFLNILGGTDQWTFKQMGYRSVMPRVLFPFHSSFHYLSVRAGAGLVATGDGLLTAVRLTLVLVGVQMFDKEHHFVNMNLHQSRLRYSILFGLNVSSCLLLCAGILVGESRPWPVLMVPWLVMFLCCSWLYYPNIIYHHKAVWPIVFCVLIMVLCLYCWCVVLSYFLNVLDGASPRRLRSEDKVAKETI